MRCLSDVHTVRVLIGKQSSGPGNKRRVFAGRGPGHQQCAYVAEVTTSFLLQLLAVLCSYKDGCFNSLKSNHISDVSALGVAMAMNKMLTELE